MVCRSKISERARSGLGGRAAAWTRVTLGFFQRLRGYERCSEVGGVIVNSSNLNRASRYRSRMMSVPGFSLYRGMHPQGSELPKHAHDDPTLCYVLRGRFTEYIGGQVVDGTYEKALVDMSEAELDAALSAADAKRKKGGVAVG